MSHRHRPLLPMATAKLRNYLSFFAVIPFLREYIGWKWVRLSGHILYIWKSWLLWKVHLHKPWDCIECAWDVDFFPGNQSCDFYETRQLKTLKCSTWKSSENLIVCLPKINNKCGHICFSSLPQLVHTSYLFYLLVQDMGRTLIVNGSSPGPGTTLYLVYQETEPKMLRGHIIGICQITVFPIWVWNQQND